MNEKIMYFADATCDLPPEFIKEHNIQIIGLRYNIGDTDGWYTTANKKQLDEFYARMRKGDSASTSLVLYEDAKQAFEPFFKDGYDIIHFGLSSGLAKTWENANNAGNDIAKKYGRKFFAPDTKCVTIMHLFIIERALQIGDFDKIVKELPGFYSRIHATFTVEDLKYLHKSGRLSGAAKVIGSLLNVKPMITVNEEGKLISIAKKKGRLASIQYLTSTISGYDPNYYEAIVVHADCLADAKILEQKVREQFIDIKTRILDLGFIIGTHVGPGALGIGYISKK